MIFLANKSLQFVAERYEDWMAGQCISQGHIDMVIESTVSGNSIIFKVDGAESLGMNKEVSYPLISEDGLSVDLKGRLQYVNPEYGNDSLHPIVCQVFYEDRTISYIRFAMSYPDRIIEFYGKTVRFDGVMRPDSLINGRISGLKRALTEDVVKLYRQLLKENSANLYIMDHQMACIGICLRKYYSLLAMMKDTDGNLKDQVFKDISSTISNFYPIFGNEALNDARNWFYKIAANHSHADAFIQYYFSQIESGEALDFPKIFHAFSLT